MSITAKLTRDLQKSLPTKQSDGIVSEIGEVIYVGDGVCKITGLPGAHIEDLVRIQAGDEQMYALILGINMHEIEAVILGEYSRVHQGDVVQTTGDALQIPSGEQMFGRIVSPLGMALDGGAPIARTALQPIEIPAPGVAQRQPVTTQLQSGILVVDSLVPLGRGQRELVIGDRKSGKSRLMANLIINQKGKNVPCIYVAIGAQKAKVRAMEELLRQSGAMEYTCIVMAGSDDPSTLNYLAPYAGTAIAEYFMHKGQDVVIVYDDLSKHAKSYRQMSLLLKRSPGRDAYPGDIFYLHSRLLERSSRLREDLGGGSLTAFPMAETQNGDLSEYICTNLMSITDGHIYLDLNLLHSGILPAVDSSASVSRIGGGVQPQLLRKVSELCSTQIAHYNEVKSFESINTELSVETERTLKRGKRILELFNQTSDVNLNNAEIIFLMYLVTAGKTDAIEVNELSAYKRELIALFRTAKYKQLQADSLTVKTLPEIEPAYAMFLADFVHSSVLLGAKALIDAPTPTEQPHPIIPDPN